MLRVLFLVVGYFFGIFQTAYIYGRAHGIDIREHGSGNSGTTNALRVLGKKAGLVVFLGDFFKAIIACSLTHVILSSCGFENVYTYMMYTAAGVILGHSYPFYMQFKGGKGIAATAGVAVGLLDWRIALVGLVVFVGAVAITKFVSLGSMLLVTSIEVCFVIFAYHGSYGFTSDAMKLEACIVLGAIALLAIVRHHANIGRLIAGTENKLSFGKGTKEE